MDQPTQELQLAVKPTTGSEFGGIAQPPRPPNQLTTAVWTRESSRPGALGTEGAFVAADESIGLVRERPAAAVALTAHLQHGLTVTRQPRGQVPARRCGPALAGTAR
jgi:hypothetical protein